MNNWNEFPLFDFYENLKNYANIFIWGFSILTQAKLMITAIFKNPSKNLWIVTEVMSDNQGQMVDEI